MATSVVPVQLRSHLIPFFSKQFNANTEAHYLNQKVKACKIDIKSSIGKMIRIALEKCDYPVKPKDFFIYFQVPNKIKKSVADIYVSANGANSFLQVPPEVANDINDLFEDFLRYTLVVKVQEVKRYAPNISIDVLISDFMEEYELDNYGIKKSALRRMCDREIEKGSLLSRFQNRSSRAVKSYPLIK